MSFTAGTFSSSARPQGNECVTYHLLFDSCVIVTEQASSHHEYIANTLEAQCCVILGYLI